MVGELVGVPMHSDPHSVHEHLSRRGRSGVLLERLETPLVQELKDWRRWGSDRDVRHESEVLDESTGLSFWRLGGANHSPVGVVELTRLGNLSISTDGGIATTEMGEGGREGVSVEDLGDSGSSLHRLLLISPVSGRERVLKSVGDCSRADGGLKLKLFPRLDALHKFEEEERVNEASLNETRRKEEELTFWRCR